MHRDDINYTTSTFGGTFSVAKETIWQIQPLAIAFKKSNILEQKRGKTPKQNFIGCTVYLLF